VVNRRIERLKPLLMGVGYEFDIGGRFGAEN
jgi:hypothetical protein